MTGVRARFGLFDALERVVDVQADAVAVRCGASAWSFSELRDRVVRLANAWRGAGIEPGDRVAVLADNCHGFVEVYWACAYLGAVAVPLERRLSSEEIRTLLGEVRPALVVAGTLRQLDTMRPLCSEGPGRPAPSWVTLGGPPAALSPAAPSPASSASSSTSSATPSPASSPASETQWSEELIASASPAAAPAEVDGDDPIAVFYTAAVEGRSRGAVVTHRNLLAQAIQTGEGLELRPGASQGLFLPLAHTFGAYLMFVAACRGVANTVLTSFDPLEAALLIDAGHVTFFAGFAPMPARIADAADEAGLRVAGRLQLVMGLDGPATIQRYLDLGVRWMNFYGQTETAGLVALGEVVAGTIDPSAVGRPLVLSRVSLRDPEGGVVASGEAGEAWVRSDVVVKRYWPDEPTRLTPDGWLRTGDVLAAGPGQSLRFIGRTTDKDLVKPGGLNVYPAEVEAVLAAHPGVSRAFVFGVPDLEWRERVCAVVVPLDPADPPDVDALRAHCRSRAARFKCPRAIVVLGAGAERDLTRATARERYRAELEALEPAAAEGAGLV